MIRTLITFVAATTFLSLAAQPAAVEWLKKNNTTKGMHILSLLQSDATGYYLLREKAEASRTSIPFCTQLDTTGGEVYDQPIPGFDTNTSAFFRFGIKGTESLLIYYEQKNADNTWRSTVRQFNYHKKQWAGPETDIFAPLSTTLHANATTGFRVSADGQRICLYRLVQENTSQSVHIAMFDGQLNLLWKKIATLPKQEGATVPQQFFCSNSGQVFLHARQYSKGAKLELRQQVLASSLSWPDGHPIYQNDYATSGEAPACSNVVMMIGEKTTEVNTYFLEAITKYTRSFEIGEDNSGQIICAGLGGDDQPDLIEKYFIYKIDPALSKGEMVKSSAIPATFRKAFMSESAAEQKKPAEDVALRWVKSTPDGKIWMLAEQENINDGTGLLKSAALIRLDSTYRIAGATPVEKYNKVNQSDRRCFASVSACMTDKSSWWMLWHETNWPEMRLLLTPVKGKESFELATGFRSGVAMLNNTLLASGGNWYFAGESEDGKTYRIGILTASRKNSKK